MSAVELVSEATAVDLARECLYRFLATALSDPLVENWRVVLAPENQRLAGEAADLLREEAREQSVPLGFGELPADDLDLTPLLAELRQHGTDLCSEYDRVFGLVPARECPPYETEYQPSSEAFFRSQQMADIAGFYHAFGIEPAHDHPERPDHISLELEFMAIVLMKKRQALNSDDTTDATPERTAICDDIQHKFLRDHLIWWLPSFANGLRRKADTGFYAELGKFLAAFVPAERMRFDLRPARIPVQAALIERPEADEGCAGCSLQTLT